MNANAATAYRGCVHEDYPHLKSAVELQVLGDSEPASTETEIIAQSGDKDTMSREKESCRENETDFF